MRAGRILAREDTARGNKIASPRGVGQAKAAMDERKG